MNFRIRELKIGDYDGVFLETLSNLTVVGEIDRKKFREIFRSIQGNPNHRIFVAENENSKVIGAATLFVEQELDGPRVAHIEDVATRKGFQRIGVGSALVSRVLTEAEKIGCRKAVLDCSWDNVPFYKKFGFVEGGERHDSVASLPSGKVLPEIEMVLRKKIRNKAKVEI